MGHLNRVGRRRHWAAMTALPLLGLLAACGSSAGTTGTSSAAAAASKPAPKGPVTDEQAATNDNCKIGTEAQIVGCQLGVLDRSLNPVDYPSLVRQASRICNESPRSIAGQTDVARHEEQSEGASHTDSFKTLLHILINDGPLGSDGCAGTLAAHVTSVVPH